MPLKIGRVKAPGCSAGKIGLTATWSSFSFAVQAMPPRRRDGDQGRGLRALTYNALRLFHEGHDCIQQVSMAKLVTQRAVLEIADQSLQIHGGYGYMREYGIEQRPRRPPRPIGGDTDEIVKEIIGKTMGL